VCLFVCLFPWLCLFGVLLCVGLSVCFGASVSLCLGSLVSLCLCGQACLLYRFLECRAVPKAPPRKNTSCVWLGFRLVVRSGCWLSTCAFLLVLVRGGCVCVCVCVCVSHGQCGSAFGCVVFRTQAPQLTRCITLATDNHVLGDLR